MHHDTAIHLRFRHRVRFTRDALDPANDALAHCFNNTQATRPITPVPSALPGAKGEIAPARVLPFIDTGLLDAQPDLPSRLAQYAQAHRIELAGDAHPIPGGEPCKNDPQVIDDILRAIHHANLDRHSYVLIVGGGAVLDAVGFAAAIAHRGVRTVRMPSTTLSQDDSGVGVKTGVNRFGQKNYLGTFHVPWAVLNDETLLITLHARDWRSGFSEAVKVALLKDADLFAQLCSRASAVARRDLDATAPLLRRSANLHLDHIVTGGDPFELGAARPLDFGHWAAHKLEAMTDFALRHGEAVAIGLALDVTYAQRSNLLPRRVAERVRTCLREMGFALYHDALADVDTLLVGLDEFRAHLGGELAIPMITDVARPMQLKALNRAVLRRAIDQLRTADVMSHEGIKA